MKSRITSIIKTDRRGRQKGSLLVEAMVGITILSLFTVSALSLTWGGRFFRASLTARAQNLAEQGNIFEKIYSNFAIGPPAEVLNTSNQQNLQKTWYGDWSDQIVATTGSPISTVLSDMDGGFGGSTCSPAFFRASTSSLMSLTEHFSLERNQVLLPADVFATDIQARHGKIYLSTDSAVQARPDLYIFDSTTSLQSSLQTGPGLSAIAVAGHYIYAANMSATGQLQVIDILDQKNPALVSHLKLPLPTATTTASHGISVFYSRGKIYLGTDKWDGQEFSIIDVTDQLSPKLLGGFEIGSAVQNIFVRDNKAYVATASDRQLLILDVGDPSNISLLTSMQPVGWQIEVGNRVTFHHENAWFGRAGGGFNTSGYKELFKIDNTDSSTESAHIIGGVYGIVSIDPYIFVASGANGGELDIFSNNPGSDLEKIGAIALGAKPVALACDGEDLYVATADLSGFIRIKFL